MEIIRYGKKSAYRFVTPSGVTGVVATCITQEQAEKAYKQIQRKLRRSGNLPKHLEGPLVPPEEKRLARKKAAAQRKP